MRLKYKPDDTHLCCHDTLKKYENKILLQNNNAISNYFYYICPLLKPSMRQFSKYVLLLSILLVIFIFIPALVHAQGGNPGCDPSGHYPDNTLCPIDGGLTALLAVGVGYGIKKARDARKPEL